MKIAYDDMWKAKENDIISQKSTSPTKEKSILSYGVVAEEDESDDDIEWH